MADNNSYEDNVQPTAGMAQDFPLFAGFQWGLKTFPFCLAFEEGENIGTPF